MVKTEATALTTQLNNQGFIIINDVYTYGHVEALLNIIDNTPPNKDTFRKTADLFAIRQFFKAVPKALPLIFNDKLKAIISQLFGEGYFVTKAIYFDKPPQSNWFVAYHQDLTISVDRKAEIAGFSAWTVKQNQFAVQPPLAILQNNFTIRIHLDDTDEHNGALKVVKGSNLKGIYRPDAIDWAAESEEICQVNKGGVMVMSPLLLHASNRSTNSEPRRVIHIEFSNSELPPPINWAEKYNYHENH
ncbi:phytanoyl-CoA dioxygenase PhyH [Mucilaginibacter gracilis]|uniref:Phytanoyl-CoA dioxygenase PhyH n=1 Tax=Mucilaginibacter gracilis TaxID=423350 RepID=A0A495J0B1_9SPHI|nr:phytanoyl-CoA dioxygenase family protein [Mucilaginibacter gracilis]RKR81734.1 phytanoyl-CoA dioxygenase PhyH [Mucilaginibacter gracilis]